MTDEPAPSRPPVPIACDMTGAPDTPAERIAEYRRLFSTVLAGRERTGAGVRFRFRADDGVEAWVRDLVARERACCAFFTFTVERRGDELWWDASVPDDDAARTILDQLCGLAQPAARGGRGALSGP